METVDGRRLRRDRNRDAVVDAMLALYAEGQLAPSSEEIAARAGLSPRSLFRYFDDIDDLCRAAIARQHERVGPFVELQTDPSATLAERIAVVVDQRIRLFEAIGSVGEVSRLRAPFQPLIATELAASRAYLRRQLRRAFAAELDALDALGHDRGAAVLAAADVVTSFEAYQLLRHDQQLASARAADVLVEALTRLLTPHPSDQEST